MKFLSYAGLAIVVIALVQSHGSVPRQQGHAFMEVEDYQKCKEIRTEGRRS